MAAKEIIPLYDAMIRMFCVSMPNDKIPTQILAHVLNIPVGTMKKVITGCPLPNGVQLVRGGHRGLEWFLTQATYTAPLGRVELAMAIKKEPIWAEYGLTLNPHSEEIVIEVGKILDNINKLKGSNKKKEAIIRNGDPAAYRVMWFSKNLINGEYYHTVHQAIGKSKVPIRKSTSKPQDVELSPIPEAPKPPAVSPMEKYGLINFVVDIQGLITTKEQYAAVIKQMEHKINRDYPALISLKEREKAEAEREAERLMDRVKILEKIHENQTQEIKNLKKHPKFAGFVEKRK